MIPQRRQLVLAAAAAPLITAAPWVHAESPAPSIVIIGGGFGGATAARYLRRLLPNARLTLIEPSADFVMCPMSNRVIHGGMSLRDITRPYDRFVTHNNIRWVKGAADEIDTAKREVRVGRDKIAYDKLIVSPGVDYVYDGITGLDAETVRTLVPHAWKAGPQTQLLKTQLQGLKEGGTIAIHIPKVPYRCPPGPYERASLMAYYLSTRNPKAKVMVFDSNPEIQAKKGLFEAAWKNQYAKLIEYVPNAEIEGVDAAKMTVEFKVHGKVKVDALNVIPPQRAGVIADRAGLANVGKRWCGVDFLSYQSTAAKDVHVLGDSIANAPGTPKSGHMANQEAKVCATAIAAEVLGVEVPKMPIIANTCYSFISQSDVIHVAGVYRYDDKAKTMVAVKGAGGLSTEPSKAEGIYAMAWAANILADTLG